MIVLMVRDHDGNRKILVIYSNSTHQLSVILLIINCASYGPDVCSEYFSIFFLLKSTFKIKISSFAL